MEVSPVITLVTLISLGPVVKNEFGVGVDGVELELEGGLDK